MKLNTTRKQNPVKLNHSGKRLTNYGFDSKMRLKCKYVHM